MHISKKIIIWQYGCKINLNLLFLTSPYIYMYVYMILYCLVLYYTYWLFPRDAYQITIGKQYSFPKQFFNFLSFPFCSVHCPDCIYCMVWFYFLTQFRINSMTLRLEQKFMKISLLSYPNADLLPASKGEDKIQP